jgi:hypothetical protein
MKRYMGLAAIAAAAVTTATGTASAGFHEVRTRSWGDTFGGSDAGGTLRYVSSQENLGAQAGNGTKRMYAQTSQSFEASARLIGKRFTAFAFDTRAVGSWIAPAGGAGALAKTATAEYVVFGKETNATPAACGNYQCASVSPWSTSGTLAEVDRTVVIGFVPVNLRGKLSYSLSTSLDSKASASKYLGINDSILARVSSSASASARLSSNFQICSPNCSFGFGGQVDLTIVRASVTPTTSSALAAAWSPTFDARYSWTNEGPLTVRVLDGKFSLTMDLGFEDWTWDIYKWNGYSWSENLWSDTGSATCTDWQSNKGCSDIINE